MSGVKAYERMTPELKFCTLFLEKFEKLSREERAALRDVLVNLFPKPFVVTEEQVLDQRRSNKDNKRVDSDKGDAMSELQLTDEQLSSWRKAVQDHWDHLQYMLRKERKL